MNTTVRGVKYENNSCGISVVIYEHISFGISGKYMNTTAVV